MPISSSEPTSTGLRPIRSPRYPPTMPPTGRTAKPIPNVANDNRVPDNGSEDGKKTLPKYSAAAVPKPMKS
jgi:hypothetical protein